MKAALCDSNPHDLQHLYEAVKACNDSLDIIIFDEVEELLKSYQRDFFDIIFLDPVIVSSAQRDLAGKLMYQHGKPIIIYVTDYEGCTDYAIHGYGTAFRFLIKPVSEKILMPVLRDAIHVASPRKLVIMENGSQIMLPLNEIFYIEIHGRDMTVYTLKTEYQIHGKLRDLEMQLPTGGFGVPYKGYLVNMDKVEKLKRGQVTLTNQIRLPVSRRYYRTFHRKLVQSNRVAGIPMKWESGF